MPRIRNFALTLVLFLSSSFVCSLTLAQRNALIELYGEGVHRYFAADYMMADQYLTRVIDSGVADPRAYYFRGLAREALGYGGQPDFESGAQLEVEGRRVADIGFALTRIQGALRMQIEKARLDARVQARLQQVIQEQMRDADQQGNIGSLAPTPPVPSETDTSDPFGAPNVQPQEDAVPPADSTPSPEVDNNDPFGDDPAMPGSEAPTPPADPFGTPESTQPAADPFGTPAEPAPAADPFGTPPEAPAVDNPFGDPPAGGEANPFGDPAPSDGLSNPFDN